MNIPSRTPLVVLVWAALALPNTVAQPGAEVELRFGSTADSEQATKEIFLRPNIEQDVFLFVRNTGAAARKVTVRLLSNGSPLLTKELTLPADGKAVRVPLAAPDKPADVVEPLTIDVIGEKNETLAGPLPVEVARPSRYLDVVAIRYLPRSADNPTNRLVVRVRVKETFAGPRCRVELVLRPERIAGLTPGQKPQGVYAGFLSGKKGEELSLIAEGLSFAGPQTRQGPVSVTVDGYDRAFLFNVTFPDRGTPAAPTRVDKEGALLDVPDFAAPQQPLKVGVEVDNAPRGSRVRLQVRSQALVTAGDRLTFEERYNDLAEFRADRRVQLTLGPGGGALRFKSTVSDWAAALDVRGIHGRAVLRLQMLDARGDVIEIRDNKTGKIAVDGTLRREVVLDDTEPAGVRFVRLPKFATPGKSIALRATTDDAADHIGEVVFIAGKPDSEGKLASGLPTVTGKLVDEKKRLWAADLLVAEGQKGPLDVTVRFTKKASGRATATAVVPVVQAGGARGSIAGRVLEGPRPQAGLTVELRDGRGEVKATVKTDMDGKFLFKDLMEGNYRLSTAKLASATRGETSVRLKEGEEKVLGDKEEIRLYR